MTVEAPFHLLPNLLSAARIVMTPLAGLAPEALILTGAHGLVALLLVLSGGAYVATWWRKWRLFREAG